MILTRTDFLTAKIFTLDIRRLFDSQKLIFPEINRSLPILKPPKYRARSTCKKF